MKSVRRLSAAVSFALLVGLSASAEQTNMRQQQVVETDDRRTDALRRGDPAPLEEIYADDYTLVRATGQVKTKSDQIRQLQSGELRFDKIDVVNRTVRTYGDVAVVLSTEDAVIFQQGQGLPADHQRITRVYKYMDGRWRVIATHATPIRRTPKLLRNRP